MAKKSKSKKSTMIYLAAILFSALVIGMAFLPVFTYKTVGVSTHINGFQMMQGAFSEKIEGSIASLVRTLISNAENRRYIHSHRNHLCGAFRAVGSCGAVCGKKLAYGAISAYGGLLCRLPCGNHFAFCRGGRPEQRIF